MNRAERIIADGFPEWNEPVEFYGKNGPWSCFSNFSPHGLWLPHPFTEKPVYYKTGEHRYQAMKATTAFEHDQVVATPTAYASKEAGRAVQLWDDWGSSYGKLCWFVMCEVVIAKAMQNPPVRDALERTGNRLIWEDSPTDDIWGVRYREDYRGKNLLGQSWMWARGVLRWVTP